MVNSRNAAELNIVDEEQDINISEKKSIGGDIDIPEIHIGPILTKIARILSFVGNQKYSEQIIDGYNQYENTEDVFGLLDDAIDSYNTLLDGGDFDKLPEEQKYILMYALEYNFLNIEQENYLKDTISVIISEPYHCEDYTRLKYELKYLSDEV